MDRLNYDHGPGCPEADDPLCGTPCSDCGEYDEPSGRDDPESISNLMAAGPPRHRRVPFPRPGPDERGFTPGRWWRVTYIEDDATTRLLWCETSSEVEARAALAQLEDNQQGLLQRLFERVVTTSEWRQMQ